MVYFQFPLWDSGGYYGIINDSPLAFQFPLWDSRNLIIDTMDRNNSLSIPFMGFQAQFYNLACRTGPFQFPLWDSNSNRGVL